MKQLLKGILKLPLRLVPTPVLARLIYDLLQMEKAFGFKWTAYKDHKGARGSLIDALYQLEPVLSHKLLPKQREPVLRAIKKQRKSGIMPK